MIQIWFLTLPKLILEHAVCRAGRHAMGCMIIISIRSAEMMMMMIGCSYISGNLLRVRAFRWWHRWAQGQKLFGGGFRVFACMYSRTVCVAPTTSRPSFLRDASDTSAHCRSAGLARHRLWGSLGSAYTLGFN